VNHSVERNVLWFVLFFSLLLALGYFIGHRDGDVRAGTDAADRVSQDDSSQQNQATVPLQRVSEKKSAVAPADLKNLNGKEFIDSLPTLETLAGHGDLDAVHVLINRLGSCGDYHPASDEEIRAREDSSYRRNLDAVKSLRANNHPIDPHFSDESLLHAHEAALRAAFDERDLCTSLTPRQIERRFDWIRMALERHDRQTILDAVSAGGGIGSGGIERVRNAEKLNEIAQIERSDLDALIATGDITALDRAAHAFGSGSRSLFQRDATLAYAYAYAWTLADSSENVWQTDAMKKLMEDLASGSGYYPALTSAEIDQARARGLSLFQSCCAAGVRK
jgi:hypothetical protein